MSFFFRTFARKTVQRVKKYAAFCLIVLVFMACENRQPVDQVGKDLTVVFATTSSMTGDGYNELILQGLMESIQLHQDIALHLLKPDSIGEAVRMIRSMFSFLTVTEGWYLLSSLLPAATCVTLIIGAVFSGGLAPKLKKIWSDCENSSSAAYCAGCVVSLILFALCLMAMSRGGFTPFIYTQF